MPLAQASHVGEGEAMNDEQGLHHIDTDTPNVFDRMDYYLTKAIDVLICLSIVRFLTAAIIFLGML